MRRMIRIGARLGLAALVLVTLHAEVRLAGRVTNENNVPVAGARIIADSASLPKVVEATSDPTGAFVMLLPAAGSYSLKIDREGFYIHTEPAVVIPEAPEYETAEIHVVLQTIHAIHNTVDVAEVPGMVDM